MRYFILLVGVLFYNRTIAQPYNLNWAKASNVISGPESNSIQLDHSGNIILGGSFHDSIDFDFGNGVFTLLSPNVPNGFILKYTPGGNFVWAKQFNCSKYLTINKVLVDKNNNIFSAGAFNGTADFDPGINTYNVTSNPSLVYIDFFISKLDSNGNFFWAKNIGGIRNEEVKSISLDKYGNVYVSGYFEQTVDFDPGPGVYNLQSGNSHSTFILKLDSAGNFKWAKHIEGFQSNISHSIVIDSSGNPILTGYFNQLVDFDPDTTNYFVTGLGTSTYILKLDSAGNFKWVKTYSSDIGVIYGVDITLSKEGNIFCTGYFTGSVNMDVGMSNFTIHSNGTYDAFLLKLDSIGNFKWAKSLGGALDDIGVGVKIDSNGNVYSIGRFEVTADFDPDTLNVYNLVSNGGQDLYFSKLDSNGNFNWAFSIGGYGLNEYVFSHVVNDSGAIYATGLFQNEVDFDPSNNIYNLGAANFNNNMFVCKFNQIPLISSSGDFFEPNPKEIFIYPNSFNNSFQISNNYYQQNSYYIILDILGKELLKFEANKQITTIDLSGFPSGFYLCKYIQQNTLLHTYKIYKE